MAWDPNDPAPPWLAPQQPPMDPYGPPDPYAMPPAPGQALADPWAIPPPAAPPPDAIPPPPPQVDATTSPDAGISPHEQYLNNVADVSLDKPNQTPAEDAQTRAADFAKFAPQDQADIVANGDPQKLAQMATDKMDPQQLADIALRHEQARLHQQAADMLTTSRDNEAKAAAQYKEWMDAQAKAHADTVALNADAQRLAATKIDSRPDVVTAIIGIVMSGLYAGMSKQGSPNLALQSFSKAVDMAAQDQRDNLANAWKGIDSRRNAIGEEVKYHGDVYRASTAFRVAAYDSAIQNVQTQAQNYDPQGTTAIQLAQLNQGLAAQRAQAVQAYTEKKLKDNLEIAKAQREDMQAAEVTRHNKAQEGLEYSKFGLEKDKNSADNAVLTPEQYGQLGYQAVPPVPMSQKQYGTWLEAKSKNEELAGKQVSNAEAANKGTNSAPVQIATADDGTPVVKTQQMIQGDGKTPWRAPEKFGDMLAGAANVNRLADKLSREIAEFGGQSDLKKGKHWQDMKSDYQDLVFALHGAKGIEGFRPGTSDLLHELTGDVDPTSFVRDARAGIQRAKQNVNEDVNQYAVSKNYTGAPITFPDMSAPAAPNKTKIDQLGETLLSTPDFGDKTDAEWSWRVAHKATSDEGQAARMFGDASPEMQQAIHIGLPPSKLEALSKLNDALTSPLLKSTDEKVAKKAQEQALAARKALEKAAQDSPFPYISDAANRILLPNPGDAVEGEKP